MDVECAACSTVFQTVTSPKATIYVVESVLLKQTSLLRKSQYANKFDLTAA